MPDGDNRRILCGAKPGDYFEVKGEMISFPENQAFSMYSLGKKLLNQYIILYLTLIISGAVLPLLAAKQRCRDENDWMWTDALVSCPDPNCPTKLKIIRTGVREFQHNDTTVVPL